MRKLYAGTVLLVLCAIAADAQSFYAVRRERSVILTAGTGASTYFGELSNPKDYIVAQPGLNVGLQYYLLSRVSVRAELNWFVLAATDKKADDPGRVARNLSFRSSCFEFNFVGQVNLIGNGNRYYRRPGLNLYGFGGIGLLYFNPKADYQGKAYALEPLHTEGTGYSRVVPVIPFGLGLRIKTGPHTNISFEGGFRKTFTDHLDDVSNKYIDNTSFTDPVAKALADPHVQLASDLQPFAAGHIRGNPKTTDWYMLVNVKLEYYLPWDLGNRRGNGLLKTKRSKSMYNRKGTYRRR